MFKKFVSAIKAHSLLKSDEIKAYLPSEFITREEPLFPKEPNETQLKMYQEFEYLAVNDKFSEIAAAVEQSYQAGTMMGSGLYECEYLIEPLEAVIGGGCDVSKAQTERAAKRFGQWYAQEPNNPYAAALAASALHSHGYAYRGTGWAHDVSDEGWEKLAEYTKLALDIIEKSAPTCSDHWFWRTTYLELTHSSYRGPEDHYMRFEKARETLPYSRSLWGTFAYQLLPRWFGSEGELRKIQNQAYKATKDTIGDAAFLNIMHMICEFEGTEVDLLPDFDILRKIADNRAKMEDDKSLTIACGIYCWLDHLEPLAELMPKIKTFNHEFWYYSHDPNYMTAMSVQMRGKGDKKAA